MEWGGYAAVELDGWTDGRLLSGGGSYHFLEVVADGRTRWRRVAFLRQADVQNREPHIPS
jgi:hypothetical protein